LEADKKARFRAARVDRGSVAAWDDRQGEASRRNMLPCRGCAKTFSRVKPARKTRFSSEKPAQNNYFRFFSFYADRADGADNTFVTPC
jgi:hypothetical protein